jgi:uncharacterized protein YneF (UPF0154 family)
MSKTAAILLTITAFLVGVAIGTFWGVPHSSGIIAILKSIFETPASAAALIAALLAFVGGVGGPWVAYRIGSKQAAASLVQALAAKTSADAALSTANNAGNRAIANVRLERLRYLRDNLSEYHSILMSAKDDNGSLTGEDARAAVAKSEADERRLYYLGTQLDFLLNQEKPLQRELWKISDDILNLKTKDERQERDEELVVAARAVMDFQWKRIKREMQGE